ncbi:MAG TPA: MOSC domain-containing protein [Blastocatellia bacterium]|nr:MOSC domain-containing protein [Blastocatellia bacterium]
MSFRAGKLTGIFIGTRKGAAKIAIEGAELVAGHGIKGDSHAGRDADRQVSLFESELLGTLRAEGFDVTAEKISANLITENIRLDSLAVGTRLRIGSSVIEISEPRVPCRNLTRIDNRLPKRLYGNCGLLGRITAGGIVRAGDSIEVLTAEHPQTTA